MKEKNDVKNLEGGFSLTLAENLKQYQHIMTASNIAIIDKKNIEEVMSKPPKHAPRTKTGDLVELDNLQDVGKNSPEETSDLKGESFTPMDIQSVLSRLHTKQKNETTINNNVGKKHTR